ncbi:hypothetical protein CAP50_07100 [Psychrobacter sp. L7]|nr:hypothetical protein CAP50_07100 [Psychrobacter sp. L7]
MYFYYSVFIAYLASNNKQTIHPITNHYLFKKYISYRHFFIAINNFPISAYNGELLSFDDQI